jgi:Rps23 Pro-64 3,4-dihydroxylase Tpa1-like proline 4-hydroxylase
MNDMNNLFFKKKVVDYDILLDMKYDMDGKVVDAGVQEQYKPDGVNLETRSTKLKQFVKPRDYPDICEQLHKIIGDSNFLDKMITVNGVIPSDLKVNEFNYLIYEKGDHFVRHRDIFHKSSRYKLGNVMVPQRRLSTSTLISESTDFDGGELILYDDHGNEINPGLEVGETIVFDSRKAHKVNPVTKGTREVLVAWFSLVQECDEYDKAIIKQNTR